MELRKEYAEIVEREKIRWNRDQPGLVDAFLNIALACQELADRPPRELTDAEITAIFRAEFGLGAAITYGNVKAGRTIIAAFLEKQREPETVKFRAARRDCDGFVSAFHSDTNLGQGWDWLDADGKPQEFEVKLP